MSQAICTLLNILASHTCTAKQEATMSFAGTQNNCCLTFKNSGVQGLLLLNKD